MTREARRTRFERGSGWPLEESERAGRVGCGKETRRWHTLRREKVDHDPGVYSKDGRATKTPKEERAGSVWVVGEKESVPGSEVFKRKKLRSSEIVVGSSSVSAEACALLLLPPKQSSGLAPAKPPRSYHTQPAEDPHRQDQASFSLASVARLPLALGPLSCSPLALPSRRVLLSFLSTARSTPSHFPHLRPHPPLPSPTLPSGRLPTTSAL